MTIRELIEQLEEVPEEYRDERIAVYVQGHISGILDIEGFKTRTTPESRYHRIATRRTTYAD